MKCTEICELMPDLAAGMETSTPEVNEHLKSCAACTGKLAEVRQTMALLDEWRVPEPSPYFDTRLMARVREEKGQPSGWWQWMRKPALAVSLAVLMGMSITLFRNDAGLGKHNDGQVAAAIAEPGSAVSDLSAMDKNSELYSDFDVLDDLQVQQDVNANP
jgi:predicted anti-sigma-YlaC factor YlaD